MEEDGKGFRPGAIKRLGRKHGQAAVEWREGGRTKGHWIVGQGWVTHSFRYFLCTYHVPGGSGFCMREEVSG